MNLLRPNPEYERKLIEQDNKDKTLKPGKHSFQELVDNLNAVNMGRAITERGEGLRPLRKSVLLNPYSPMEMEYEDNHIIREYRRDSLRPNNNNHDRFTLHRVGFAVKNFVSNEFDNFNNVIGGLTRKNMYRLIMDHKRECLIKAENRRLEDSIDELGNRHTFFGKLGRLYPLPKERYDLWARRTYVKLKSPRFNKHFIDSVDFGTCRILMGKSRVGKLKMTVDRVIERHIGLILYKNLQNNVSIGFEMDGGCYIMAKRNNTKRQHLWMLIQYGKARSVKRIHAVYPILYGTGAKTETKKIANQLRGDMNG